MTISINWRIGTSLVTDIDHGSSATDATLPAQIIFIEHDGANQLTNCKFWIDAKITDYEGDKSPITDLAELKAWGDGTAANTFGGFFLSMNAAGSFPSWPTYTTKSGVDYFTFKSGVADSIENAVSLHTNMNSTPAMSTGIVPPSCSVWPSFACRIRVPALVHYVGTRQVTQKLRFTYTS